MKNKILVLLVLVLLICLISMCFVGCSNINTSGFEEDAYGNSLESMFVIVERQEEFEVVYHKNTKVMYVVSCGYCNTGTFTLLVDENGNPLLWQGS